MAVPQVEDSTDCKLSTVNQTTCTEIDFYAFQFYTCPAWLVICASMLCEFFRIQLGILKPIPALGRWSHYAVVYLGAIAIFLPLPFLYYWATGKQNGDICPESSECLGSVLVLYLPSLLAGLLPYFGLASYLLWKHYKHATRLLKQTKPETSSVEKSPQSNAETGGLLGEQDLLARGLPILPTMPSVPQVPPSRSLQSVMASGRVLVALKRWQRRAATNYKPNLVAFVYWVLGMALFVVTWVMLMVFSVTVFQESMVCNWGIFVAMLLLNFILSFMQTLVCWVMGRAERQRIGSWNAGFHRFHLVNLTRIAFHFYKEIFQLSVLVKLENWSNFLVYYAMASAPTLLTTLTLSNGRLFKFLHAHKAADGQLQRFVCGKLLLALEADLLQQRGLACFNAYLRSSASHIATASYCIFILCLKIMPNRQVYSHYSTESGDQRQQIFFCLCAWSLDYVVYTVLNLVFDRRYNLSPTYVGLCYLRDNPKFRIAVLCIGAHIISDWYLMMTFAAIGGVNLSDSDQNSLGLC